MARNLWKVSKEATDKTLDKVGGVLTALGITRFFREVDNQLFKHTVPHGAAELASAIFSGSAFVMYPHSGQDIPGSDKKVPKQRQQPKPDKPKPEPEQERGMTM